MIPPEGDRWTISVGYTEQSPVFPIVAINGEWIGTMRDGAGAAALCNMMEGLAATPPENMDWQPLEVVNRAAERVRRAARPDAAQAR